MQLVVAVVIVAAAVFVNARACAGEAENELRLSQAIDVLHSFDCDQEKPRGMMGLVGEEIDGMHIDMRAAIGRDDGWPNDARGAAL